MEIFLLVLDLLVIISWAFFAGIKRSKGYRMSLIHELMFVQSLSLLNLIVLSSDKHRSDIIRDFYKAKRSNIILLIKLVGMLIGLNAGMVVWAEINAGPTIWYNENEFVLSVILLLVLSGVFWVGRLNACMTEYRKAIEFMDALKQINEIPGTTAG